MKKIARVVSAFLFLAVSGWGGAGLSSCVVDTEVDDGTVAHSLRYCVENVVDGGKITFARDMTIKLTQGALTLYSRGLTIDGETHAIVIEAKDRDTKIVSATTIQPFKIRYVADKELVFRNLTFRGAATAVWVGLGNSSTRWAIRIESVLFEENKQAVYCNSLGEPMLLLVDDSTFRNNVNDNVILSGVTSAMTGVSALSYGMSGGSGSLSIQRSSFESNDAYWGTIVILTRDGANVVATIDASTFYDNGGRYGSCIATYTGTTNSATSTFELKILNSTFYANEAREGHVIQNLYGDVRANSTFKISNATIFRNRSGIGRYVLYDQENMDTIYLKNSILYGNVDAQGDAANCKNVISSDYNILGDGAYLANTRGMHDRNVDPKLAPFGAYGGPTKTLPPLDGSPALDNASNEDVDGVLVNVDQRGVTRPIGLRNDIGSVEGSVLAPNIAVPLSNIAKALLILSLLLGVVGYRKVALR